MIQHDSVTVTPTTPKLRTKKSRTQHRRHKSWHPIKIESHREFVSNWKTASVTPDFSGPPPWRATKLRARRWRRARASTVRSSDSVKTVVIAVRECVRSLPAVAGCVASQPVTLPQPPKGGGCNRSR